MVVATTNKITEILFEEYWVKQKETNCVKNNNNLKSLLTVHRVNEITHEEKTQVGWIHTYIHTYKHAYIDTNILTFKHAYKHTYIHTYIHTHTYKFSSGYFARAIEKSRSLCFGSRHRKKSCLS